MDRGAIAVVFLGRGISMVKPGGHWGLTGDIEVCDEKFAHLPVRMPEDDNHPNSIVGGGELNLLAGLEREKKLRPEGEFDPRLALHAYCFRSKYLKSIDGPSESLVMSDKYCDLGGHPGIVQVFNEDKWQSVADLPSNTNQEIDNVFTEALRRGIRNVAIVTVAVHAWRANLMAQRHLSNQEKPYHGAVTLQFYASENVLMEADPAKYGERCRAILGSKSFQRNLVLEQRGVNALLSGTYRSVQSATPAPKA